jgi:hypothetical protein
MSFRLTLFFFNVTILYVEWKSFVWKVALKFFIITQIIILFLVLLNCWPFNVIHS